MHSLITEAVSEAREIPNRVQQLEDIARRLRDQFIDRQLAALAQQFAQPGLSDDGRIAFLQKQQEELRLLKKQSLSV
jgi:transcription elongation GreA/GreB family factor